MVLRRRRIDDLLGFHIDQAEREVTPVGFILTEWFDRRENVVVLSWYRLSHVVEFRLNPMWPSKDDLVHAVVVSEPKERVASLFGVSRTGVVDSAVEDIAEGLKVARKHFSCFTGTQPTDEDLVHR